MARPRRAAMPVLGAMLVLALWTLVAHDSGLGWVQTVGALVTGVVVVGLVAPGLAVTRLRARVVSAPADAVRGEPAVLVVALSGPGEVRAVEPPGPAATAGARGQAALEVVPSQRGLLDEVAVELASAAPFGLVWWTRSVVLRLARPVAVAPRVGEPAEGIVVEAGEAEHASRGAGAGGELRGVRPYEHGDRRKLVHWPATAHTGQLMVRESERPARRAAVVDGALPPSGEEAEVHAERVLATVARLLVAGSAVELRTLEPGGEVLGAVRTVQEAGRRLALALPRRGAPEAAG